VSNLHSKSALSSIAAIVALIGGFSGFSFAMDAEYAIRWNPADGGPKTVEETLEALADTSLNGLQTYTVQYFEVRTPPSDAPQGATTILRGRSTGTKYELALKYRSVDPLSVSTCGLPGVDRSKYEVDVSLGGRSSSVTRFYSFSCQAASVAGPIAPPVELEARPSPCVSRVTRRNTRRTRSRIEEWRLQDGGVELEVSREGTDSEADLAAFKGEVADPLLAKGIKPSPRTKSEIGSTCP
jgi:hypothetical protein